MKDLLSYLVVVFFFSFTSTVIAQEVKEKPIIPFAMNLSESFSNLPADEDCTDSKGEFDTTQCARLVKECKFETVYVPPRLAKDVRFEYDADVGNEIYGLINDNFFSSIRAQRHDKTHWSLTGNIGVGSKIKLFEINNRTNEYKVFDPVIIPATGVIQLKQTSTNMVTVRLNVKYSQIGFPHFSASVLGNQNKRIGAFRSDPVFRITEGRHAMFISDGDREAGIFIDAFPKNQNPKGEVVVDVEQSIYSQKPDNNFLGSSLGWKNSSGIPALKLSGSITTESRILEMKSLKLKKTGKDIKSMFSLINGEIAYSSKAPELKIPQGEALLFDGICEKVTKRRVISLDNVFADKHLQVLKGSLEIYFLEKKFYSFFRSLEGDLTEFKPNTVAGYSSEGRKFWLHRPTEIAGNLVNLGAGPWGENGWVNRLYYIVPDDVDFLSILDSGSNLQIGRLIQAHEDIERNKQYQYPPGPVRFIYGKKKDGVLVLSPLEETLRVFEPSFTNLLRRNSTESEFELYGDPPFWNVLGSVRYSIENSSVTGKFRPADKSKPEVTIKASTYQGSCGNEDYALFEVQSKVDEYLQIGPGPWGKSGWLKGDLISLSSLQLPFNYKGQNVSRIRYSSNNLEITTLDGEFLNSTVSVFPNANLRMKELNEKSLKLSCENVVPEKKFIPAYVDLLPEHFAPYSETFSCKNGSDCRTMVVKCDFSESLGDYRRIKLQMEGDARVESVFGYDMIRNMTIYPSSNIYNDREFIFNSISIQTPLYMLNRPTKSEIELAIEKVPSEQTKDSVVMPFSFPKELFTYSFKLSTDFNSERIPLYLGEFLIGELSSTADLIVKLGPGTYPFRLIKRSNDSQSYNVRFPFVSSPNAKVKSVTITKNDLGRIAGYLYYQVRGDLRSPTISADSAKNIKISSFEYVGDETINLLPFIINKDSLNMSPEKSEEFRQLLMNKNHGVLTATGECTKEERIPSFHSIPIHAGPSEKKPLLGSLKISFGESNHNRGVNLHFFDPQNEISRFVSNILNDKCLPFDDFVALHQITDSKRNWSNLGSGPWGENGWIRVEARSFFDTDFIYEVAGKGTGRIKKSGKKLLFTPESEQDMKTPEQSEISSDLIFDQNGRLKAKFVCELGC